MLDKVEGWEQASRIVQDQIRETVKQEAKGVTIRMATITCPCGQKRAVVKMYQCLYCNVWFCHLCAEHHFGKTVKQYKEERNAEEV